MMHGQTKIKYTYVKYMPTTLAIVVNVEQVRKKAHTVHFNFQKTFTLKCYALNKTVDKSVQSTAAYLHVCDAIYLNEYYTIIK